MKVGGSSVFLYHENIDYIYDFIKVVYRNYTSLFITSHEFILLYFIENQSNCTLFSVITSIFNFNTFMSIS